MSAKIEQLEWGKSKVVQPRARGLSQRYLVSYKCRRLQLAWISNISISRLKELLKNM
ncbi:MAG TPA: hypothetical protein VE643_04855 [Nitrososphaeraceae archaeon]|nr:hypothetical protein [Nitrososphaeraceae archaeon]